jgi:ketosteroid isomerase-like protein
MSNTTLSIVTAYYAAMSQKNLDGMERYLHPDVQFIAPLAETNGKESSVEALKKVISLFKTFTVRNTFASEQQAMLVYDVVFSEPVGKTSSAVLVTVEDELIIKIEFFYDPRKIEQAWKKS